MATFKGRSQCVSVAVAKDGTQNLWCVGTDSNPYQATVTDKNSTTKYITFLGIGKTRDHIIWITNKLNSFGNESVFAVDKSKNIIKLGWK